MNVALVTMLVSTLALPGQVKVSERALEVEGRVYFETASAVLRAGSMSLLEELAKALIENPRFTKLTIEGHTDSLGSARRNLKLSRLRAEAVSAALQERGVDAARLVAVGRGGEQPIASNENERGRALNRRVDFIVDLLGEAGKPKPPAKISQARNRVEAREPERETWRPGEVGLGLYKLWRVQSRDDSSAEITFRDTSRVQLREDTLVIVYGPTSTRARRLTSRAKLERGSLRARLDELAGQSVTVEIPAGEAEVTGGSALMAVLEGGESVLSNHAGKPATLRGQAAPGTRRRPEVVVNAGFGSSVKPGLAPIPPRKLPAPPSWTRTPAPLLAAVGPARVEASWTPVDGAVLYRVEFYDGERLAQSVAVPREVHKVTLESLPTGRYEVRLSTLDERGFESVPSAPAAFELVSFAAQPGARGAHAMPGVSLESDGLLCSPAKLTSVGPQTVRCQDGSGRELPSISLVGVGVTPRAKEAVTITRTARTVRILLDTEFALDKVDIKLAPPPGLVVGEVKHFPFAIDAVLRAEAEFRQGEIRLLHQGIEVGRVKVEAR